MRHRKSGLKLNRTASHRKAMFRNMVTSLFKHDRIRTTDTKAKELRRWADHIITLAKRGDLHARRQALAIVTEKDVVHKLFETAAARFGAINGGYTRIVKLGRRAGDAAPLSMIELVTVEDKKKPKKKKKSKAAAAKKVEAKTGKETKKKAAPKKEERAGEAEAAEKKKAEPKKKAAPKKEEGEKKTAAKKKAAPKKEEGEKKPAAKKKAAGGAEAAAKKKAAPKKAAAKKDEKKEEKEDK